MSHFDDEEAFYTGIPLHVEAMYPVAKGGTMENAMVKFTDDRGQEMTITSDDVRRLICPQANDKEVGLFLELCKAQRLNPFVKDAYLVKYGSSPASIITSKEVFTKRAQANPKFEGMQCGVTLVINGQVVQREGSMVLKGWELVGGWCKVYVKGYRVPIYEEVSLAEYSTGKSNWSKMPATMIRKVAMCHALREAFPDDFQGLYGAEEMGDKGQMVPEVPDDKVPAPQPAEEHEQEVLEPDEVEYSEPAFPENWDPNDPWASVEQMGRYMAMVKQLAQAKGIAEDIVKEHVLASNAMADYGLTIGDPMTSRQVEKALLVLDSWIGQL